MWRKKINKDRIWGIVMLISTLLLLVNGVLKVVVGDEMFIGVICLFSAFAFAVTFIAILKGKINFNQPNDGLKVFFPVGFVFMLVGAGGLINTGVWGFGFVLFIVGILFSPHSQNHTEEENAE